MREADRDGDGDVVGEHRGEAIVGSASSTQRSPPARARPGKPLVAATKLWWLTMRLWTWVGVRAEVNAVSKDPPPLRLSSPRPDVRAVNVWPTAVRRLRVTGVSAEPLASN